jgi:hypothetical protein
MSKNPKTKTLEKCSWETLNAILMASTEKECVDLLELEKTYSRRKMFLLRIHSRINALRAARERVELIIVSEKK